MSILDFITFLVVPKKKTEIHLDPEQKGIRIGKDLKLISWESIKELRADILPTRFYGWWSSHTIVTTNNGKIYSNHLPDSFEKTIIQKAGLTKNFTSFWLSQKIYHK